MSLQTKLFLLLILIFSIVVRGYGINWDSGFHLHPDERMIVMTAENLSFPNALNPKFFAYGSLPIYLLHLIGSILSLFEPKLGSYDYLPIIGRCLSLLFDTLSVFIIFLLGKKLFASVKISLLASLVYSLAALPVQLSHFYAVDTLLNFFILFTLYRVLSFFKTKNYLNLFLLSLGFSLSLATKVSSLPLIVPILALLFFQKSFKKSIHYFLTFAFLSLVLFFIFEPFAFLDFSTFWRQINEQRLMTKDAFIFPYTLQYVGTLPFLYSLKNIFLWGFGPFSLFSVFGLWLFLKNHRRNLKIPALFLSFFIFYFFITGSSAVKFMRYYLPLYPLICLFSVYFFISFKSKTLSVIFILYQSFWLLAFTNIYRLPNTRVSATNWINQNVPRGSVILREHWDDGLPLTGSQSFDIKELPLYDPDVPQKWHQINKLLQDADYIIIASNRLYIPLQKLTDCGRLPPHRCYSQTAKYYQELFSGELGFAKVAEFSSYPKIFGIKIFDDSADESFTVYDHPVVMVFQKTGLPVNINYP